MSTDTQEIPMADIESALTEAGMPAHAPEQQDAAAPYGRRADGAPKDKPGRKPGARSRPRPPRRRTASSAPPRQPAKRPAAPDYYDGILGVCQIPAGLLAMAGIRRPTLAADAAAIDIHAPGFAQGLNQLARENPQVAAILDKVLQMGPWGAVLVPLLGCGMQMAVNHGWLSSDAAPGTIPREELLSRYGPAPTSAPPADAQPPP